MKRIGFVVGLLLLLASEVWAAGYIDFSYAGDTSNLYAILRKAGDRTVWDHRTGQKAWVAWNNANITDYNVPLVNYSGDYYQAAFPSTIAAGTYKVSIYLRAGATAAITDNLLGTGEMAWDGTSEINLEAVHTDLATAQADLDLYDTDAEYAGAIWNAATASYGSAGTYGLTVETISVVSIWTEDLQVESATPFTAGWYLKMILGQF